ncbi:hypothetical protein DFH07DRAFT_306991 [Mycena maculata]|uniref:Uncharacterized protein n=1 Tax=Mycena maculata TaxID=230809 RepID=A0AAD7NMX9_9AGAR|nr:hypothetical protein DFH07DRAFT_306991 [Mycena maculata]
MLLVFLGVPCLDHVQSQKSMHKFNIDYALLPVFKNHRPYAQDVSPCQNSDKAEEVRVRVLVKGSAPQFRFSSRGDEKHLPIRMSCRRRLIPSFLHATPAPSTHRPYCRLVLQIATLYRHHGLPHFHFDDPLDPGRWRRAKEFRRPFTGVISCGVPDRNHEGRANTYTLGF